MLGDGSDGDLIVLSGQTVNLNLNQKYQFRNIRVDAGGTISTTSTTGSVLYLLAIGTIVINGTINLSGKVTRGQNTWTVLLDGTNYASPSCSSGGVGGYWSGGGATYQNNGFGSGGSGLIWGSTTSRGGNGGATPGSGGFGNGVHTGTTANATSYISGNDGGVSAGGGGGAYATFVRASGDVVGFAQGYNGAQGGNAYGANGGNGANPAGTWAYTGGSSGGASVGYGSGAGGGAGGAAGNPGVHLVLKASEIILNSGGTINLSGTSGGNGGNGGIGYTHNGAVDGGLGGGGGGGGHGGTLYLRYGTRLVNNITLNQDGGAGGSGGLRGRSGAYSGGSGYNGSPGSTSTQRGPAWYGNMLAMFQ